MPRSFRRAALLCGLLAVSACAAPADPGGPDGAGPGSLAGTEWRLAQLPGSPITGDAWIAFEAGGEAGGDSGCNSFGARYDQAGASLAFSDMVSTMRACVDPARMDAERIFMAALTATRRAERADGLLRLTDADGAMLATLAPRTGR